MVNLAFLEWNQIVVDTLTAVAQPEQWFTVASRKRDWN